MSGELLWCTTLLNGCNSVGPWNIGILGLKESQTCLRFQEGFLRQLFPKSLGETRPRGCLHYGP